ncbi:MAG: SagB/ThcOx family dehydrogenase [Pseudomonadota bacterium]|nr:MAG: SagB/ThcOx family dehydrogenase [Pseudomonadota bacterium]
MSATGATIVLPPPARDGGVTVEQALSARRSVRAWAKAPLTLAQTGQLLWAAQGVTHSDGLRTAPSAGALYPLEIYVVAGAVEGLVSGTYRYLPQQHALQATGEGDDRAALASAAYQQGWLAAAPAIIVIAAVPKRTARKYGARAERYVAIEAGHAAQNVYLQAEALGLGTTLVGAFADRQVSSILGLPKGERPLCLLPVGKP